MAAAWGWRSAFFFFAATGFIVAMMAWRLGEPARGEQDRRSQSLDLSEQATQDTMSSREAYTEILKVPTFTVSMISSAVGSIFFGGIGVWSVTFLIRYHNLTVAQASVPTSLFALGGLAGALAAGTHAVAPPYRGPPADPGLA